VLFTLSAVVITVPLARLRCLS